LIALYAGSMGDKQGLELLAEVAERLRPHPHIRLVLCGAGAARPRLERALAGRANVILLSPQPEVRLNALLNAADIHLLPQRAAAETFALPSKLAGILASGRPLIAQAEGGELAAATRGCGTLVAPGDAEAMAKAIIELAADSKRRRLGQIARQLAEDHLDREAIIARYEQRLSWLVTSSRRARAAPVGAGQMAPGVSHLAGRIPAQLQRG
jgi:colanic acid biosynthesis glycosyl transferase WcaI